MFHGLGFELDPDEINNSLSSIGIMHDDESTQSITMEDFVEIAAPYIRSRDVREETEKLFLLFDEDQTGSVSFQNLKNLSMDIGLDISNNVLIEMIAAADQNGDGSLCIKEFESVINRCYGNPLDELTSDEEDNEVDTISTEC